MVQGLIAQKMLTQAGAPGASNPTVPPHLPWDKLHVRHVLPPPPTGRTGLSLSWDMRCLVLAQRLPGAWPCTPGAGSILPAAAPCPWHIGFHWDPATRLIP